MRIGLVSTLATPVIPDGGDSVETLVHLLARELIRMRHEVTVFAAAGSVVPGAEICTVPGTYGANGMPPDYLQCELVNLVEAVRRSAEFDVLHSHAYLLGRLVEPLSQAPMVHTLHVQPYESERALLGLTGQVFLTAPSSYQWAQFADVRAAVVPHGVDPSSFTFRPHPEERLCWLGRFIPGKSPLNAIRIAREADLPLLMAGPSSRYFREVVQPHVDGVHVEYVGPVTGAARDELLGNSSALLYPVLHGEPFGLVLAEAMMCGTPVVATDIGAAPEVVQDGITGRVVPLEKMAAAVPEAVALDRASVREAAADRFSPSRMAREYAEIYARAQAGSCQRERER